MNSRPSETDRQIARFVASVFDGERKVIRHQSEPPGRHIDVVQFPPSAVTSGMKVCSTLGLSALPVGIEVEGVPLGVELYCAMKPDAPMLGDVVATCAFHIMDGYAHARPNALVRHAIECMDDTTDLNVRHALLVDPFWGELRTQYYPTRVVTWLFVFPITDPELKMIERVGCEAFLDEMERQKFDCFDLRRDSIQADL
ncbi:MAG: suppressor of fused domain protein [bacterium]|nr:suppressor of fused domain protein [bacterium]